MTDTRYVLDEQIGFWLRVALQRHRAIFTSKMTHDLTPIQFAAMAKILEVGPCSQSRLARLICVDPATTKGVVDRLCKRDLLEIIIDPNDLRRREMRLTEQGREIARLTTKVGCDITAKTLIPLNESEKAVIISLLAKLSGFPSVHEGEELKSKMDAETKKGYAFADKV